MLAQPANIMQVICEEKASNPGDITILPVAESYRDPVSKPRQLRGLLGF